MASVNCDAASVLLKEQEFRKMMPESKKMQQNFTSLQPTDIDLKSKTLKKGLNEDIQFSLIS